MSHLPKYVELEPEMVGIRTRKHMEPQILYTFHYTDLNETYVYSTTLNKGLMYIFLTNSTQKFWAQKQKNINRIMGTV
jgi:hypothetical protein